MPRTYGALGLAFPDRKQWDLGSILAHQARRFGDKPFLIEPGRSSHSYAEMDRIASRIATGLNGHGIGAGERVLAFLDNGWECIALWFGAARAGVADVPTNTQYFGETLRHCVTLTKPRALVMHAHYVERFVQIEDALRPLDPVIFVVGETAAREVAALRGLGFSAHAFDALLATTPAAFQPRARWELGAILFTSGTTGLSKGVMMSHAHLYLFSELTANLVKVGPDDVWMVASPLFHGNALFMAVAPSLIYGATVALYEKFSPSRFGERLAETGATIVNFVGVMMDWAGKSPETPFDAKSKLRCVFAAPTAWSTVETFKRRFGAKAFVEVFGLTETCCPIMAPYGEDRPKGAAGLLVSDWFEVRLADPETDEEVPVGQVGELQIRNKEPWTVSLGYYGMAEATAESRRNLWFHTGDGLRRDEDGWYYFVDRLKDCLRRRGENISSFEVERPILTHPAVSECAAVGIPADEEAGEDEVGVFIVTKDRASVTPQEIIAWSQERLPAFLVPRYVAFVASLPTTPSGKVRKTELRAGGRKTAWDRLKSG